MLVSSEYGSQQGQLDRERGAGESRSARVPLDLPLIASDWR